MSPRVRAAIVATGQTEHASRRLDVSMAEMAREAVDRCLGSRGLAFDDIDAVVAGNMEMFEGIYLVDQFFIDALGALGKPLFKLNTGGTVGPAWRSPATTSSPPAAIGEVLGVGFEKQSDGSTQAAITTVGDPIWERAVMAGCDRQLRVDGLDLHPRERRHRAAGGEGRGQGAAATPAATPMRTCSCPTSPSRRCWSRSTSPIRSTGSTCARPPTGRARS